MQIVYDVLAWLAVAVWAIIGAFVAFILALLAAVWAAIISVVVFLILGLVKIIEVIFASLFS